MTTSLTLSLGRSGKLTRGQSSDSLHDEACSATDRLHLEPGCGCTRTGLPVAQEARSCGGRGWTALSSWSAPQATFRARNANALGDLSLAYTPGVAVPCLEIARDPSLVYKYTAKGNLVAVVTNGTAVLGLGNIGPAAGKPVMEGKAVLFKRFADIDVFDIELATTNPEEIVRTCQLLEPTFGGINLEDIKAPECFYIEEECRRTMKIPVFHDDQHGTAIISGAALLNA